MPQPGYRPIVYSAAVTVVACLAALPAGCSPQTESSRTATPRAGAPSPPDLSGAKPVPTEEEWTAAHTQRVEIACGSCHRFAPPSALPRHRWEENILSMAAMPRPDFIPALSVDDLALAIAYYTRRAPESLPWRAPLPALSDRLRFRIEHFTPRGLEHERIPAVAHVNFVNLSHPERHDLLVAEMRSRALLIQSPWGPTAMRQPRPLAGELNYPVHTQLLDANADGRRDLLIASLGGMNPSNDVRGAATILFQDGNRRFQSHVVAGSLGRVADVRGADLDGDGDIDLIVTAFGWRGPGQLLVLENQGGGTPPPPRYRTHLVDDRDGFIHAEFADVDADGRLDFVTVLSQEHEEVLAYLNRGEFRFEAVVLHRAPHPGWGYSGLQLVDLDGDGDADVLVSNGDTLDDDLIKPYHGVSVLENQGGVRFVHRAIGQLAGCERAVAADLDGDGDLDVVAVAFLPQIAPEVWSRHQLDSVIWLERGPDEWIPHSLEKARCYHPTVAAADYNGDGKVDLAVGNFVWLEPGGRPRFRADYITLFTAE